MSAHDHSHDETLFTTTCPWCSAPRETGPACPRCGADYARAEAIRTRGRAPASANQTQAPVEQRDSAVADSADESPGEWTAGADPELEWRFCVAAIPIALCLAVAFHASGFGGALQRIFLTMPIHELGHAITAWFCGFTAIPTLWKTLVPESRGFLAPLALAGALGYMMYRARLSQRLPLVYAGGALLLVQAVATFGISSDTARMLVTFGGDGAGMILAVLLMGSFFFGKDTQLYQGSLRWGFLVIGAAAFVDMFATWWKARNDQFAVPYGTVDGQASDSMTLMDVYGWSSQTLIDRYVVLGVCCLVALALVYAWGVWRAKSQVDAGRLARKSTNRARGMRELGR